MKCTRKVSLHVMPKNSRNLTRVNALRQTSSRVKLVIHREDDDIYEMVEVEIRKKKHSGLGLTIVGNASGPGVFISEVVKGTFLYIDYTLEASTFNSRTMHTWINNFTNMFRWGS